MKKPKPKINIKFDPDNRVDFARFMENVLAFDDDQEKTAELSQKTKNENYDNNRNGIAKQGLWAQQKREAI